jgi:probable F420-dependent oxidoreductase
VRFGVYLFPTAYALSVAELARAAEARGFESLWLPEHTHIPVSRRTPWLGGGALPEEYRHTLDPFVALATAAAATERLRLGTGVCLVTERDPITLAKEVASLDLLSGGRFLFGIGAGWNVEELAHHGTEFGTRWRVLRERVLAMKAIWTCEEPQFHGEYVNFERIWLYPKPVQKPHPPLFLGAATPRGRDRVIEYCDGWLPLAGRGLDIVAGVRDLRARAERAGRDPETIATTVYAAPPDAGTLDAYRRAGVDRAVFALPSAGRDTVLPLLDQYLGLIGTLGPAAMR